jgi:hypothetical protein
MKSESHTKLEGQRLLPAAPLLGRRLSSAIIPEKINERDVNASNQHQCGNSPTTCYGSILGHRFGNRCI